LRHDWAPAVEAQRWYQTRETLRDCQNPIELSTRKEKHVSRLEAIARGLYYRTQDPLAEPLAHLLQLPSSGVVNVLDPGAGSGLFHGRLFACIAEVAQQRSTDATLVSYGVEPNRERAQQARRVFTHLLCADFFHTRISKGRFQLSVLNPPYDDDLASGHNEGSGQQRLEFRFLRRTTQLLAPDAVLVYIIPQAQILPAARYLAANYTALRCWRYPDVP
jgi:tRNA1(Val) A37 N6-methylase TrmN6